MELSTVASTSVSHDSVVMILHSPKMFLLPKSLFGSKNKNNDSGMSGMRNMAGYIIMFYTDDASCYISKRAVVSREAKKKQHACAYSGLRNHYSELFIRTIGLNF